MGACTRGVPCQMTDDSSGAGSGYEGVPGNLALAHIMSTAATALPRLMESNIQGPCTDHHMCAFHDTIHFFFHPLLIPACSHLFGLPDQKLLEFHCAICTLRSCLPCTLVWQVHTHMGSLLQTFIEPLDKKFLPLPGIFPRAPAPMMHRLRQVCTETIVQQQSHINLQYVYSHICLSSLTFIAVYRNTA
jgi:hypothetical protein